MARETLDIRSRYAVWKVFRSYLKAINTVRITFALRSHPVRARKMLVPSCSKKRLKVTLIEFVNVN